MRILVNYHLWIRTAEAMNRMSYVAKKVDLDRWVEQEIRDKEAKGLGETKEEEEEIVSVPHDDARPHWGEVVARVPPDHKSGLRKVTAGFFLTMVPFGLAIAVWMVIGPTTIENVIGSYLLAGFVLALTLGISSVLVYGAFRLGTVSVYQNGLLLEPVLGGRRFREWGHFMAFQVKQDERIVAVSVKTKQGRIINIHVMLVQYPDVVKVLEHEVKELF